VHITFFISSSTNGTTNWNLLRPIDKEYNDLKSKSQEAEQEFKLAQMKVSDAREHVSTLRKNLDGMILSLYIFDI
jgi:hypothetical protein